VVVAEEAKMDRISAEHSAAVRLMSCHADALPLFTPQLDPSEAAAIAAAARNPASVLGGGLNMCGVRYMVLRADDGSIYVRKGSDGACIAKTNQCVLIGLYGQCPRFSHRLWFSDETVRESVFWGALIQTSMGGGMSGVGWLLVEWRE